MKCATVVIGANYGDEGKGLLVDYLADKNADTAVVVRFNGGAQAGHTVQLPDGRRHVFSHFGAGTLAGAETYLAKHYVCNPLLFWKEKRQLDDFGVTPVVAADPRCFITTAYDMLINQAVEDARGDKRHGSVGVGFGETIERNNYPMFQLWKSDLADREKLIARLRIIRESWLPTRCKELSIPSFARDDHLLSDSLLERTADAAMAFDRTVTTAGAEFLERKSIVFEGAQGLALDMGSKNFPHVTRSNTGLTNVMPIASMLGLSLDVVYVTRPYLTKHGAGPLPGEYRPDPPIMDETNRDHPYQGPLRFGALDVAALRDRIASDRKHAPTASWSIALTCSDQMPETAKALLSDFGKDVGYVSDGPSRQNVTAP